MSRLCSLPFFFKENNVCCVHVKIIKDLHITVKHIKKYVNDLSTRVHIPLSN